MVGSVPTLHKIGGVVNLVCVGGNSPFPRSKYNPGYVITVHLLIKEVWDEITYTFLNFNSCTVEV